jgi:hypothetical protein
MMNTPEKPDTHPDFASLIDELANHGMTMDDPITGLNLTIEQIKINMPIEFNVNVEDTGQVTLWGTAPTQRTETTFLPVFHQMQLRIVREDAE